MWELVCRIPEIVNPLHLSLLRPHSGMSLSSSPPLSFLPLPLSQGEEGGGGSRLEFLGATEETKYPAIGCEL